MDLYTPDNHALIIEQFLQKHSKKVLLFDFDQTLCHLDLPWPKNSQIMQAYLKNVDLELYEQKKPRNPTSHVINEFIKRYGNEIWDYDRNNSEEFERTELVAVPCNHALLEWIKAHGHSYLMYIWSSNITNTIQSILENEGYAECFQKIVGKDAVRLTKPNPDGFQVIFDHARELVPGIQKADCLMIGNNPLDDKGAAQRAGIDFVRVQYSQVQR